MPSHEQDSASDSSVSGDWEQQGGGRNTSQHHADGEQQDDGQGGKKGGKKDLSHVACRFYRVGACTAGASCPFSHSAREPGQTKQPCKWFQKGSCKFGHKCANAHIMPGDPPSMDWKNKKAAKVAQQAEAGGTPASPNPLSPNPGSASSQFTPASPPANGSTAAQKQQQQKQPVSSGLSSMFGRNGTTNGSVTSDPDNVRVASIASENAVAAIGMSPIGLPLPADLPLPAGVNTAKLPGGEPSSATTKPKLFSYASVVGSHPSSSGALASSPNTAKTAALQQDPAPPSTVRSPTVNASLNLPSTSPSIGTGRTINPASPSFVPRNVPPPSQNPAASSNGLSTSIPSTFSMDKLERGLPAVSSHGAVAPAAHQGFAPGSFQRLPHQPSPLAPPPLQHSQSHTSSIPTRSFLNQNPTGSLSPSLTAMPQVQAGRPPIPSPATAAFGTSPFGNNAIFLSTSHEEDSGSFMARAHRSSGVARGMSPARTGFDQPPRASFDSRSSFSRNKHGSSALADDEEDGTGDDNILEEELVPSSLKHLLTPDEKARRDSRSGAKSGFFNPFNDTGNGDDDNDDYDHEVAAELRARYSQSVPAPAASALSQFNRAPGSPPTFVGHGSPFSSGLVRPVGESMGGTHSGGLSSNLAKHLLGGVGGAASQGHRIERGFAMADEGGLNGTGNSRSGQLSTLGTSLPQGMAAGLSRLHMIPAGSEHTGYTPPASFVQSPSGRSHLSSAVPQTASSPTLPASNSFLAPGSNLGRHPAPPGTSYGIKLPSLLHQQHPGVGSRKISSNYYEGAQVHVGSPLARTELHGPSGTGRDGVSQQHRHQHDGQGHSTSDAEDEDLVFDMDV